MPYRIGWLDRELRIYEVVLLDPYTDDDQAEFFEAFFAFMDATSGPTYGLFDTSHFGSTGAKGLNDPRFKKFVKYRGKIRVTAMVTRDAMTAVLGRLGAILSGEPDWIHIVESREAGMKYLRERAKSDLENDR